ncbi:hypothetical protein [Streptomyces sp. NPDC058872]
MRNDVFAMHGTSPSFWWSATAVVGVPGLLDHSRRWTGTARW